MAATGRTEARPEEPRSANTPGKPEELAIARRKGNNTNGNVVPEWQRGMENDEEDTDTRSDSHTRRYIDYMRRYEKYVPTTYHV